MLKQLIFAALAIPVLLSAAPEDLSIVIPQTEMAPGTRTGLLELRNHLYQITGKRVNVVKEPAKGEGRVIYYGNTKFAANQKIDLKKFGDEEWTIRSVNKDVIVAGGEPRGNLYAAYHFLEDVLGVRWLTPWTTYIPKTLEWKTGLNLRRKPALAHRSMYLAPGDASGVFLRRNRCSTAHPNYGGRMDYSHFSGRQAQGGGHTLYTALGEANYIRNLYKQHPEYFPLIDGKRKLDAARANGASQSQWCMTNPELRQLWIAAMRKHIKYDREVAKRRGIQPVQFYAVDQNDCYDGFCTCERCSALVKKHGAKSALMLDFANHMARELKNDAPDAIFLMMALHCTEKAPQGMKAEPNVGIRLCDTTSNMLKPWTDKENAKHMQNVREWGKITKYLYMWDYSINYGATICVNYPFPSARTFTADMKTLAEHHGYGVFFEHEQPVGADMRELKVWLEFKAAENPDLKYEDLLKDFTDHYYGVKAGAKIREYLAELETAAKKANACVKWFPTLNDFFYITPEVMIRCDNILTEAYKLAEPPALKERVEYARLSLDRLYLVKANAMKKAMQLQKQDFSKLPDAAKVKERYVRVWKREMNRYESDVRKASYFTGDYKKNVTDFLKMVELRKDLPIPPEFKKYPQDAVYLFSTAMANIYIGYLKQTKDPESKAGEALTARIADVKKCPHKSFREDKFQYPFSYVVWPSVKGTIRGKILNPPAAMPKGYHWYKLAEDVQLNQQSVVAMFAGFFVPLDGVVSDNSELGQKYDLWASIKVTGPDFFKSGKPADGNMFYIDQFAAIRKTKNGEK